MKLNSNIGRARARQIRLLSGRIGLWMAIGLAAVTGVVWAADLISEPDLLDAEKAFSLTARVNSNQTIEVRYAIADGYYMYRDRFRFSIDGQAIAVAKNNWPPGKWKQDVTFGKVITYRKSVRLLLTPASINPHALKVPGKSFSLSANSQGCADVGVCYPPLRQTIALAPGSTEWVSAQGDEILGFSPQTPLGNRLTDQLKSGK